MEKHKCQDCGFLAARNRDTRYLDEVEASFRENGTPPSIRNLQAQAHSWPPNTEKDEDFPICFKQIRDLIAEAKAIVAQTHARKVLQVIKAEKECDYFVDWKQGFTPKEHQEMLDRQWMLDYQAKSRQNDRKWHWIELSILIVGAGLFTLLGAWITSISQ